MKEKYKIVHTTNDIYMNKNTNSIWNTVYDPDNPCNSKTKSQSSNVFTSLMKTKNNNYKINTQPSYTDMDYDSFLQGKCFIKI
jgi:hypothetical protein